MKRGQHGQLVRADWLAGRILRFGADDPVQAVFGIHAEVSLGRKRQGRKYPQGFFLPCSLLVNSTWNPSLSTADTGKPASNRAANTNAQFRTL